MALLLFLTEPIRDCKLLRGVNPGTVVERGRYGEGVLCSSWGGNGSLTVFRRKFDNGIVDYAHRHADTKRKEDARIEPKTKGLNELVNLKETCRIGSKG